MPASACLPVGAVPSRLGPAEYRAPQDRVQGQCLAKGDQWRVQPPSPNPWPNPPWPLFPVVPVSPELPVFPVSPEFPVFPASPEFPVFSLPVEPELEPVPPLPVLLVPPPPTGAAPPEADETGMVVVVEVGIVVVVVGVDVVVVVVGVGVPPVVTGEPVATTLKVALGADPPPRGDEMLTTTASAEDCRIPAGAWFVPLDGAFAATAPRLAEPVGTTAPPPGTVVGVVPGFGTAGPRADRICWPIGPSPMLTPATIDSAAATTAPDAMRRLRTKYSFEAAVGGGGWTTSRVTSGAAGSGCPNVRDVKTSSKVAWSLASARSGFDPPMILHTNRLFCWSHALRSHASEVEIFLTFTI